jgi:hypothetical protein
MIQDIFLRWIVTVLLVLHAAACLFVIATGRRMWILVVGHLLHFIMSLAMVVMVWPWGRTLPTAPPMVFFLLAALWFLAVGFIGVGQRVVNGYHALMMLAMAWMYAVMNGTLLFSEGGVAHSGHDRASLHMAMPGGMNVSHMDVSGMDTGSSSGGYPAWIGAINWFCAIGFAIAGYLTLYRYFAVRKAKAAQPSHDCLGVARHTLMAAGMAIMFGVML